MDDAGEIEVDLSYTKIFSNRDTDDDTKPKVTQLDLAEEIRNKIIFDFRLVHNGAGDLRRQVR